MRACRGLSYASRVRLTWPLIGRSQEIAVIETAISEAEAPGIIDSGVTGVGKSGVAREALTAMASRGCETRWAVGTAAARSLPLGAFAAWVSYPVPDHSQLVHLVRDVLESLTAASPRTPVVDPVDDSHRALICRPSFGIRSSNGPWRKWC